MGFNDHEDSRAQRRNKKRQRIQAARTEVTVGDIEGNALLHALDCVLRGGGAVRIGRTRDGGAWAIGVYGDGDQPYTEYIQGSEDINKYLWELGEFFDQTGGKEPAPR